MSVTNFHGLGPGPAGSELRGFYHWVLAWTQAILSSPAGEEWRRLREHECGPDPLGDGFDGNPIDGLMRVNAVRCGELRLAEWVQPGLTGLQVGSAELQLGSNVRGLIRLTEKETLGAQVLFRPSQRLLRPVQ
jgi:hypothetical protein